MGLDKHCLGGVEARLNDIVFHGEPDAQAVLLLRLDGDREVGALKLLLEQLGAFLMRGQ